MGVTRAALIAALAVVAVSSAGAAGAGAAAVRPNQHFVGIVNGNHTAAFVYVVCPGPAVGQTGHPAGGQYVAAIRVANGSGSTGGGSSLTVRFADDPSAAVSLTAYGVARTIPQQLSLPCSGTGTVTFTPVPTSTTAVADSVTVTYENIAA
jgi:hypothetical protein